jgi:HEAT repeats
VACDSFDDDSLIAAIPDSGISDSLALAAEAGRRRLTAAIPALEALCRRFTGFGADRIVPEQAVALDALVMIGGQEAARTIARLIDRRAVQGPCLQKAVSAAAGLRARLPAGMLLELLRHDDPLIRAAACRCAHRCSEATFLLRDLLDDLYPEVRTAAACALGRMGRREARALLARYLREKPSAELIEAIAPVADEECVILLGRIARTAPELMEAALDGLYAVDHPRAEKIAADIRAN